MNRPVIIGLLLSSVFLILSGQSAVTAVLVSTTTTQTTTSYVTLTGTGESTAYQTLTQVSSIQTVTATTYTTTRTVVVPVQILTTVISPSIRTLYGEGVGCTPDGHCVTTYETDYVTGYVTQTGWVVGYSPSLAQSTVTSQYATSVPTTIFSTTASTSTYSTGQVLGITATQTLTSVTDQPGPSISDMLTQYWWVAVVVIALIVGVLGFRYGRKGSPAPERLTATKPLTEDVSQILRRRYAAGEISREEYQRMLKDLET